MSNIVKHVKIEYEIIKCDTSNFAKVVEFKALMKNKEIKASVVMEQWDLWFCQKAISIIFDIAITTANDHIKNVINYLGNEYYTKYFEVIKKEGSRKIKRKIIHYNLDVLFNVAMKGQYFDEINKIIDFARTNSINRNLYKVVPVKERNFGELLMETFKDVIEIIPQYKVGNYFIDFYFPKVNLAVEFDEKHHKKQIKNDKIRQTYIGKQLKAQFIRVNDGEELQGLNQVVKYVFNAL